MDLPHHPAPPPQHSAQPSVSEMENLILHPQVHDDLSYSQWDWSEFLDFSFDDQFSISIEAEQHPAEPKLPPAAVNPDTPQRIRKRNPRLDCPNFMAGRIPCACPEMDAMLEEEEGVPGNKRVRTARPVSGTSRCQVPGCEVDISELKGYHRRHRVCLQCANASVVMLDGQRKRYCQQCGKFHFLSDFDEGKRSCRRKLERHNNRRRRKPSESKVAVESELQDLVLADDLGCDDENAKESISLNSQIAEGEPLVESDEGQISTLCSNPGSLSIQNNSVVSFLPSGEAQIEGEKDEAKHPRSSSYSDSKSAYSSMCPTGRISFKLYDWNPAEFPRRLRHQIFQWLASMPVELEGYIRPGCTILTVFIAMPSFMWIKLLEDPVPYIHDFVAAPGTMLPGRGSLLVYLDNMVFRVIRDGTSVMQVKVEDQTPKLHYVHPTCFEAGKSIEFVACGSNLLQPKFRFLVSFAGKYLAYNCCVPPLCGDKDGSTASLDHQLLKIYIPITEPDIFGPAFIEVENESGISNFIPILIGNKEICAEMKIMEHKFEASPSLKGPCATSSLPDSCKVSFPRQTSFSQFILDTAWLLRKPAFEDAEYSLTSSQIGRFNRLLKFLIKNKCTSILESILCHMKTLMDKMKLNNLANGVTDDDVKFLQSNLDHAKYILCQGHQGKGSLVQDSQNLIQKRDCLDESYHNEMLTVSFFGQDNETKERGNLDDVAGSNCEDKSGNLPLLNREFVMRMDPVKGRPGKSCSRVVTSKYFTSRPLMFVMVAATFCLGVCVVLSHPHKVSKIATTIRRCLFDNM